jgi:AcrR family transcriptional regulator
MSENETDPRIARTRDKLGEALIALMQQKPFDDITVQEVLDRAGIGRSTFYAHYRDKNDLLMSDVEDFFGMMATLLDRRQAAIDRVAPVRELFAHVQDAQEIRAAFATSGRMQDVLELGRGILARSIEERLAAAGVTMEPALLKAQAHALAGSLFALLEWWIDRGSNLPPEAMDAMFHRLVWTGIGRT